jgi:ribonucleoside-triphosphate reductase
MWQTQTPFFTFNFGLGTSWFAREIQKSILKVRLEGLGEKKKTSVFPKLVFTLKRGLNLGKNDLNYDIKKLALQCSAKRIYPDILSYDRIMELMGFFVSPMGCRSFLPYFEDKKGNPMTYGRRNMGVVTLNVPRIAIQSKGDKQKFWDIFNERMKLMYDALMFRVNTIKQAKAKNAPILYQYGATGHRLSSDSEVFGIFKNGEASISIGYIGLYEAATMFYGADWEKNKEAKDFTVEIMKNIYKYKEKWCTQTGLGFSIYATPSESLTDRFCRLDIEKFGSIKNITDKGYYTNSFHYDVRKPVDPFTKFEFEREYEPYTTGGFIHYCEAPSLVNNLQGLEKIWDYAYDKVGYYGVNQPVDECFECGFKGEFDSSVEGFKCPNCGNHNPETVSCIRRLCGYLSSVVQRKPIRGRIKEISSRVKNYKIKEDDNN